MARGPWLEPAGSHRPGSRGTESTTPSKLGSRTSKRHLAPWTSISHQHASPLHQHPSPLAPASVALAPASVAMARCCLDRRFPLVRASAPARIRMALRKTALIRVPQLRRRPGRLCQSTCHGFPPAIRRLSRGAVSQCTTRGTGPSSVDPHHECRPAHQHASRLALESVGARTSTRRLRHQRMSPARTRKRHPRTRECRHGTLLPRPSLSACARERASANP